MSGILETPDIKTALDDFNEESTKSGIRDWASDKATRLRDACSEYYDKGKEGLKDQLSWKNFWRLFGLAVLAGSAWAFAELVILCPKAKSESGCFYQDTSGDTTRVGYKSNYPWSDPSEADCSDYETCCGKCNLIHTGGEITGTCAGQRCCSQKMDIMGTERKDGGYQYVCKSAIDALWTLIEDAGQLINPNNWIKWVERIGIAVVILVGVIIFGILGYKFIVWLIQRKSSKGGSGKGGSGNLSI